MRNVTYSEARNNLKALLDEVNQDAAPVLITRQQGEAGVLMSVSEYFGMLDTLHLLSSPRNAERLMRSFAQGITGQFTTRRLSKPRTDIPAGDAVQAPENENENENA